METQQSPKTETPMTEKDRWLLAAAICSAIGTAITGWLLAFFGFEANATQNTETIEGIKMFMSIFPAIGTILSVIFILMYPLSETRMKSVVQQLNKQRQCNIKNS